jgi:hypothetical protein
MEKWYLQNVSRIYVGKFLCYDKKNLIFNFSWDQQEVTFTAWNWKPQFKKKKNVHKMYSVDELQTTNCAELPVDALEK